MSKTARFIGYCRVSTKQQAKDGYSLQQQEEEILNKYENAIIYKDSYTGTKADRPEFNKVMKQLQAGDTLVVTKLDRLARNTVEGIKIVEELFARGIAVHVLQIGLLENTTMGRFFLTTLLAVAEMERNTIIERTAAGKEIARQKPGYTEGRPEKLTKQQIELVLELLDKYSYTQVVEKTGICKSTLQRMKKKYGTTA